MIAVRLCAVHALGLCTQFLFFVGGRINGLGARCMNAAERIEGVKAMANRHDRRRVGAEHRKRVVPTRGPSGLRIDEEEKGYQLAVTCLTVLSGMPGGGERLAAMDGLADTLKRAVRDATQQGAPLHTDSSSVFLAFGLAVGDMLADYQVRSTDCAGEDRPAELLEMCLAGLATGARHGLTKRREQAH